MTAAHGPSRILGLDLRVERRGLTESRASFASPLKELTFIFREDSPGGKIVFHEPRLDHRTKVRPFFGGILGVKFKPDSGQDFDGLGTQAFSGVAYTNNSQSAVITAQPTLIANKRFPHHLSEYGAHRAIKRKANNCRADQQNRNAVPQFAR